MNFVSKKFNILVWIFMSLVMLSLFVFQSEVISSMLLAVAILYVFYEEVVRSIYLRRKHSQILSSKIFEFNRKINYSFLFLMLLAFTTISSIYSNIQWRSTIEIVDFTSIKQFLSLLILPEAINLTFIVSIVLIYIYIFINTIINKSTLYDEGILLYNGTLVSYKDIEKIEMSKFVKTIRYELKVEGFNGELHMTCNKDNEGFINEFLYNKTNLNINAVDKTTY